MLSDNPLLTGVGIVDVNFEYRLTYDKVINVRREMVSQLKTIASSESSVFMFGSYTELNIRVNLDAIVGSMTRLCFREQFPPPQPRMKNLYCPYLSE